MTALYNDALIVGAGPAGSTLAIALAKVGRRPILIERSRQAEHKVCGEFLSPECLEFLRTIDIHPEAMGARTIHSLRVATRDVIAEISLPEKALSLTRRTLDEALLHRARSLGVNLLRGYTVNRLTRTSSEDSVGIWRAQVVDRNNSSLSILGSEAFLATGKHDVYGWARPTQGTQNTLVALKMYFLLAPEQQAELEGHIELILYPEGYAGLQIVEGDCANLCLLVTQKTLRAIGGRWSNLLEYMLRHSHHLKRRLYGARQLLDRPLAISSIPYGYCAQGDDPRVSPWRLGDQAAVIPSFCGSGMAIAVYTGIRAAELYLEGSSPSVLHSEIQRYLQQRVYWASMLSRMLVTMPSLAEVVRLWPPILSKIFTATRVPVAPDIRLMKSLNIVAPPKPPEEWNPSASHWRPR